MSERSRESRPARPKSRAETTETEERKGRPAAKPTGVVQQRRERYLVTSVPPRATGSWPSHEQRVELTTLIEQLTKDPEVRHIRTLNKSPDRRTHEVVEEIAVLEMTTERAAAVAATPWLHVEPDTPLRHGAQGPLLPGADPAGLPIGETVPVSLRVEGADGNAVDGASVYVLAGFAYHAVTDIDGVATLTLPHDLVESVEIVCVRPRTDYWSVLHVRPGLSLTEPNKIICERVDSSFPGFPERAVHGWSKRVMGFDRLPPTYRGHGVKIALIDSGAAADHPDLQTAIAGGRDILGRDDKSWQEDAVGHGTHCAGLLGGLDDGTGIVGLAPEAELYVCKVSPGGHLSDLLEALDYCRSKEIDVVQLSVGVRLPSVLLAHKIEQVVSDGMVCVAAVGDWTTQPTYPAGLPHVLAVSALGRIGEYPPSSLHATQLAGPPGPDGLFCARLSGAGPHVTMSAPGIAVVSTATPSGYVAIDSTAVAATHVTALAALALAHHPEFRDGYRIREAIRVERLITHLVASCRPLPLEHPHRVGAGLPLAVAAVGLAGG